ncbi:DinB family protein [Loktanella sp. SALINAS62]|uniref:DinB family protein n=1 Tax=Loktanella sp. SALINAS62 TaxID=2706124 RepID=UPI001B8D0F53|nr:DinB family protein [Loktanella sp. SALINAS62]MBS1303508.1 damage-inducible protein DinB [Loktanella sp. SALINAS62]
MIDRAYCRMMARYNAWQNKSLWSVLEAIPDADLHADVGLMHGSILGTLNHLLWLDRMWLHRFAAQPVPDAAMDATATMTADKTAWWTARFRTDGGLRMWADTLASVDLSGDMAFYSLTRHDDMIAPRSVCVMHMFNQQTHYRAMVMGALTKAGHDSYDANLFGLVDHDLFPGAPG